VHDYSGHPFQVQLSRALAARGHEVLHLYFAEFQTPRGKLTKSDADAPTLRIAGISIDEPFEKHALLKRRAQEKLYGDRACAALRDFAPDVVLSANTPLDAQQKLQSCANDIGSTFIFWVQDLYGEAIKRILSKRIPVVGQLVGQYYKQLERAILRKSHGVVAITSDFRPYLESAGVSLTRASVIENWAPLDDMPVLPRDNDWARSNGFVDQTNIVYAGTLGLKHNPNVFLKLAREVDAAVTIFSQGPVAEALEVAAGQEKVPNLRIRPWVSVTDLPKMLAAADVVCALIEPDASVFSVPSKVLTYLAAAKPVLAAIPAENLAARLIVREKAGVVVEPGNDSDFIEGAKAMLASPQTRNQMSHNGRRFAELAFDIEKIATCFEAVIVQAQRAQSIPQAESGKHGRMGQLRPVRQRETTPPLLDDR
jgi:colanic acid biosynthesis glycosyl transferase WcaI